MNMKKFFISLIMLVVLASCAKPYVIVQIADAQLGFTATDRYKAEGKEYEGDVAYEVKYLNEAIKMVNEIRPDAVIFTGDQVHNPGNSYEWSTFKTAVAAISKGIKVFNIPGNHDIYLGENEVNMEPFEERFGQGNFVYDESDVKIVGLNTNYIKYNDRRENDQFEWLMGSLKKKKGQTTVVFGHHPFFLNDIEEGDGYFQIQKTKRQVYFDLFSRNDVDAVFAGHLHDCANGESNGIPLYTSTSIAVQLGGSQPSIRLITIDKGTVATELVQLP